MNELRLVEVHFEWLKGIRDATVSFDAPLTAVMGVNGSGKTTVVHALACLFKRPDHSGGEDYRFPNFFIPNTDATWTGSKFTAAFSHCKTGRKPFKTYRKKADRWAPPYDKRPERSIYYIGIDSCTPEIERRTDSSVIRYSTKDEDDKKSKKALRDAAYILNKPYEALMEHIAKGKQMLGVRCKGGLRYSSLSMGAGEQRAIKMMKTVWSAEEGSLILIDEIELLLHPHAVKRLIETLYDIANKRDLQIVFSTHSPLMAELTDYVSIQYLHNVKGDTKTLVFKDINCDLIADLTGSFDRPIHVFVEDAFSEVIVTAIAREVGVQRKTKVSVYGSIENSFTIAAAKVLEGEDLEHTLIVTDGDRYQSEDEKLKRIEGHLTGNEDDAEERRRKALSCITQYDLPEDVAPEEFMHRCLVNSDDADNEYVVAARNIRAVNDPHLWIRELARAMGLPVQDTVAAIIPLIGAQEEWQDYTAPVRQWFEAQKELL